MTTTPTAASATKPKRRRLLNAQTQAMSVLANHWKTMSGSDKSTWKTLSSQLVNTNQNGLPSKVGAYATYIGMNSIVISAGGRPQSAAPATPTPPDPLYPVTLHATCAPGGVLTLSLTSAAPYPGTVLVYGLIPQLAGANYVSSTKYKLIGSLPALATTTDITALYLTRYRVPSPGYQLAVKLVGITASGLQTHPLIVAALAQPPADTTENGDKEHNKAA